MKFETVLPKKPNRIPCLMKDDFDQIVLITNNTSNEIFVTIVGSHSKYRLGVTWKTTSKVLKDNYHPIEKGTKVILEN